MGNREQDLRRGWRQQGLLLLTIPARLENEKAAGDFLSVHLHLYHPFGASWISDGMADQDQGGGKGPIRKSWELYC
ncbi:hypothetical protein H9L39_01171 [Fusarium oxysporum f. sp. albedinis]|jgi:hypothetical protein|nr:hypothetical protein H9L39_01171 [Fusarium oxysporum f. sp. albedinis]